MASRERLILVDGSALFYRAYFAIPANLRTSTGLHTNAIYGFATMFRKMLAGRTPERGAVVFDAPGPSFRAEKYPEYKAQRPPMDAELREQLPWIDRIVEAHQFPYLRVPGYEADDVIGTLTQAAVERDMEVLIVSGDKDFAQLIGDQVRMIDTLRDVTYDAELVRKKWGVLPHQFVDWLALVGDRSDNIPGVPGIGAKGAAKLLDTYGSLDGILEHVDELKGRQRVSLQEHRDLASLSRELATIEREVPLDLGLDDLVLDLPGPEPINALYRELQFFSLLEEEDDASEQDALDFACFANADELSRWLEEHRAGTVAIHALIDGDAPVVGGLAGVALCAEPGVARFVPIECASGFGAEGLETLRPHLEDPGMRWVGHGLKALWVALRRRDCQLVHVEGDTQLESFLVDPTGLIPHRIDQLVRAFLHRTVPAAKTVVGSGKSEVPFSALSGEDLATWACTLASAIREAAPLVRARVVDNEQLGYFHDVDLPLVGVLGQMELDGVLVDSEELDAMGREFRGYVAELEARIHELAGRPFNIASTKQLGEILFDEMGLPVIKRTKSGYSTRAEVLERLAPDHEIARKVLEHRKWSKLINTYTDVLAREVNSETGRVHATFQMTVGATGRLITTEPDLQRTPVRTAEGRRIRECFPAPPGHVMISADWSQIELRLLAHITGDTLLVEAFEKDLDVHARTAAQLHGCDPAEVTRDQRAVGKLVNFATIYGQGATALGQILGIPRKQAQSYIDGYFEAYGGVRLWLDQTMAEAHERGYVTTLMGRRRFIPELSSNSYMERQAGERIAANTPIQGSAADICKLAMLAIANELRERELQSRMLLQIHDELLFEVPAAEVDTVRELVGRHMQGVVELRVPLQVDVGVGGSWAEAH